ncbi:AAA family ATPase [Rhodococcus sp. Q]|uniref:ATP-dependent nuclease n=1 Tax=Rhodococcus sp. Q TaxID=2502252 RepID=UPI0010F6DB15|nr:AAA family ATPase [Rhodococcus sp. Q]
MPGKNLSSIEKSLQKRWDSPSPDSLDLIGIQITAHEESTGLRGIRQAEIKFDYPVSVLVGKNGAGKTTLLHLAALCYSPPGNYDYYNYNFTDFFSVAHREVPSTGIDIEWSFRGSAIDDLSAKRRSTKKWMHYERRPKRPVRFVGISRIAAPVESSAHRRTFSSEAAESLPLDPTFTSYLSEVLSTDYSGASTEHSGRYDLPRFSPTSTASYSGFNMGTGEGAVVQILTELQRVPKGGIAIIEEVELGLHPSASANLAKVLVKIADKKNIQIITTSHSEYFIDALPRIARITVSRTVSGSVQSFNGVTTRTAISGISGTSLPELYIACEDDVAEKIISTRLSAAVRRRVKVLSLGAKQHLQSSAKTLSEAHPRVPILIVWDSDMTDKEIHDSHKSSQISKSPGYDRIEWFRFPSGASEDGSELSDTEGKGLPPEIAMKATLLANDDALKATADLLRIEIDEFRSALNSAIVGTGSHHSLFFDLSQTIALDKGSVMDAVVRGYLIAIDMDGFAIQVERMLNGEFMGFLPEGNEGTQNFGGI